MAKPVALETHQQLTWNQRAIQAVLNKAATGEVFIIGDCHTEAGEPAHHSEWGPIPKHPSVAAVIEPAGYVKSPHTGGLVNSWRGRPEYVRKMGGRVDNAA